ncbi:hypothetical protein AQUCO_05900026v1 [Aquilegia coerulea]|uniref:KIB1-4 beta-propeller domain-containing protein n=1 Tax=Aquilegia coerulea TaxID=218851 RepID=A0A2G5CE08_AQUCA|nr:hypothetical protein AQUCO_05900026v1 [Aquilegia coerulea]
MVDLIAISSGFFSQIVGLRAWFLLLHNYFVQVIKGSFSSIVGVSTTTTTPELFINIKDYIRFGAVCRSWRSLYTQHQTNFPPQLPFLMLPSSELFAVNDQQTCCIYDLLDKKIYTNFLLHLPTPHDQTYYGGSSHGWLISFTPTSPPVVAQLFNPFLSSSINLPPLTNFNYFIEQETECTPYFFLQKVVLSTNPASNPNTCLVLAIFGGYCRLAFCKPGDNAWTCLELHPDSKNLPWQLRLRYRPCSLTEDIIYFENKFYTVDSFGALWVIDLDVARPMLSNLLPPVDESQYSPDVSYRNYVVQSSGHLFHVRRAWTHPVLDDYSYSTAKFEVFKLDQTHRKRVETKNLCGQMLFLGSNASLSLQASDYPGCKANCIYFTDDYIEGYYDDDITAISPGAPDMGVFNLEDGSIESHYQVRESRRCHPALIWIEPTPHTVGKDG